MNITKFLLLFSLSPLLLFPSSPLPLFPPSPLPLIGKDTNDNYRKVYRLHTAIAAEIQARLEQLANDPGYKIAGEKYHNIEYVFNLYQKNNFQPFWTELDYAQDGIRGILSSHDDGLLPRDYHLEAILRLKDHIIHSSESADELTSRAADLDLLLTDGVLFYADHLLFGKIDPVSLSPTWNFGYAPIPDLNPLSFMQNIADRKMPDRLLDLRPDLFLYDSLVSILARYREIEARGGWQPVAAGGKIEPGDEDSRIPLIRSRLEITGYMVSDDTTSSAHYDTILEKDIRHFQSTHGLEPDGIIGAGTFRELNVPVSERIATIRINLERIRWVAGNIPENYLIVNIPTYWLILVREGQIIHRAKVVVGKPLNKTPVFRDKMRYIEFNPTWTLPTSIIRNEIIPHLEKDSAYLEKNHMVLLDLKGNIVPTSALDMDSLSPARFPYLVRQEPGPWNALGVVKFMFPNEYDIYLHDTPSKSLFNKARRDYSHGCIRVQAPLDLAEKLLAGTDWDRKKINQVIADRELTRVSLPEPLDVLISYWTCGLTPDREIFFTADIYNKDKEVLKELDGLFR